MLKLYLVNNSSEKYRKHIPFRLYFSCYDRRCLRANFLLGRKRRRDGKRKICYGDSADVDESVVENAIIHNVKNFIMTFGKDFAFVGDQYHLEAFNDRLYSHHMDIGKCYSFFV